MVVEVKVPGINGKIKFDKSTGTIVGSDENITQAIIPTVIEGVEVKAVGAQAFGCESMKEDDFRYQPERESKLKFVELPHTVTSIGDNAFAWCKDLKIIEIPDSVIEIGDSAFESCRNLVTVEIPNSIESIGEYAFYFCNGLKSIKIPKTEKN